GTLEFHVWGSRIDSLEKPDRLVFDLDADEGLDFARVREAAIDLRDRLAAIGLKTVPLVTGGKGIHVIAPLERRAEWPQVKAFARGFAQMLQEEAPERYVAQASKAKRSGRIFVDYMRNERGATAVCPWSTGARAGAPIATPVAWDEVKTLPGANTFHIQDMEARLAMADPWAEAARWRQSITKSMMGAVGADRAGGRSSDAIAARGSLLTRATARCVSGLANPGKRFALRQLHLGRQFRERIDLVRQRHGVDE